MTENSNDKLSIKNILFTRARANYIPPVSNDGHKLYCCTDCGDRFIFETSYIDHVNRKSLKITYMCRHCNIVQYFLNRCNLLSHIRSHAFRTATINVSDLKIEPLPLSEYKFPIGLPLEPEIVVNPEEILKINCTQMQNDDCVECRRFVLDKNGNSFKERGLHYSEKSDETHLCPVCLYVLPNKCALNGHLRIHMNLSPLYCTDCGLQMSKNALSYHLCEGMKMMRAAARLKCPISWCTVYPPSEHQEHIKKHIKKVYKCSSCIVACFNKDAIDKHLKKHPGNKTSVIFYQCLLCPGRLVLEHQLNNHLKGHDSQTFVYPCWTCDSIFKSALELIQHSKNSCAKPSTSEIVQNNTGISGMGPGAANTSFRVVKRCDQCKRGFKYKCKYNEIGSLPIECPYGCIRSENTTIQSEEARSNEIICSLCNDKVSEDWNAIKEHYDKIHKEHKCIDVEVKLMRLKKSEIPGRKNKARKRKIDQRNDDESTVGSHESLCMKCNEKFSGKALLEEHMITHRDPCTAYQCLECGECYVVKPSFSKHLLLEHGINNVDDYVKEKKNSYNEDALARYQKVPENTEPIKENQCSICRDQFDNHDDLDKHFRGHGMAFLMKNTQKKKSP